MAKSVLVSKAVYDIQDQVHRKRDTEDMDWYRRGSCRVSCRDTERGTRQYYRDQDSGAKPCDRPGIRDTRL